MNEQNSTSASELTSGSKSDSEMPTSQVIVSFAIALYLIFLFASLLLNQAGSQLISRLARAAVPLSVLGLQTDFPLEFHFSQAMNFEDDHHFEVVVDGEVVQQYPSARTSDTGLPHGFRYQRFRRLAHQAAISVTEEDDVTLSEMARGIGEYAASQGAGDRLLVRLVGHIPYDWRQGPHRSLKQSLDSQHYVPIYEADVWRASSGGMNIHKRVPAAEASPPRQSGS